MTGNYQLHILASLPTQKGHLQASNRRLGEIQSRTERGKIKKFWLTYR
jgi:hypothetical protein